MNAKYYFPGSGRVTPISELPRHLSRYLAGRQVVATLFNSGRHLYYDRSWPRWYESTDQSLFFLGYREFEGCGKNVNGVRIQHLGHLRGIDGGPARVSVEWNYVKWNFTCDPYRLYYIVDFNGPQAVFRSRKIVVLPRSLLALG